MPRWEGDPLTEAEKKSRKADYDRARWARIKAGRPVRADVRPQQREETSGMLDPLEKPAITLKVKGPKHGLKIAVLPDCQVKPGVPTDHLEHYGRYIADKRPDVIVCIGDFADMGSLSTHAPPGHMDKERQRYLADVVAAQEAMARFMKPIRQAKDYDPELILNLGNHEDRVTRAVMADPKLEGTISVRDLGYEDFGWRVFPFLQPVVIGGVAFCHYFPSGTMGRPITTARAILNKMHMSAFAGHLQGRDIAYARRADGKNLTAIISGSFYQHDEDYLSPFTNRHWRGAWVLHEVKDGCFDEMALSLNYLRRRYG